MGKALVLASLLIAAGCTTTGSFCQISKPLRPSDQTIAAMTDDEVKDVLAHNRKGQKLCGWKQ